MKGLYRRMRTMLRVVLPQSWALPLLVVLYVGSDAAMILFGAPLRWGWLPVEHILGSVLLMQAAVVYGAHRGLYFHPFFRTQYREWLAGTPWTPRQRLPNGPVHIVWQDVLLLSAATGLMFRGSEIAPAALPAAFLVTWLVVQVPALTFTGQGWAGFTVLMLLGAFFRLVETPVIAGGCLLAAYLAAWTGLRRSLASLREWDLRWWESQGMTNFSSESLQNAAKAKLLGWPFDQMSLKPPEVRIPLLAGIAVSVLVGWGNHVLLYHLARQAGFAGPANDVWEYRALLAVPALLLAGGRVATYCSGYRPPISLAGRWFTGRWVIPRYDLVIAPALLVLAVYGMGTSILPLLGVPRVVGGPPLLSLMTLIALTMPPSLSGWRLTGKHRIVPSMQIQQGSFVQTQ
ncbi:MAG: hypothetical protein AB7U20_17645 [Planctomycetaceae bacterium]